MKQLTGKLTVLTEQFCKMEVSENERLRLLLEEAVRTAKRQPASFSRRHPKAHPGTPGCKAVEAYGRPRRRPIPKRVDEVVDVPLPERCPVPTENAKQTSAR